MLFTCLANTINIYIYIYMYVCMYVCMYVYIYIYIYIYNCMREGQVNNSKFPALKH